MKLRLAEYEDLGAIMALYEEAKHFLHAHQVDMWQNDGPTADMVRENIRDGVFWVLTDGDVIAGCACITPEPDPSYEHLTDGEWLNDHPYLVIHRLTVKDDYRRQGCSGLLFRQAETLAGEQNIDSIRIDTHRDNAIMKKAMAAAGFTECGKIETAGMTPRSVWQKTLTD